MARSRVHRIPPEERLHRGSLNGLLGAWILALILPAGGAQDASDERLAIDPNLPLRACDDSGGQPLLFGSLGGTAAESSGTIVPGSAEGTQLFGNYCVGYYDEAQAHFCFDITEPRTVVLEVSQANADTTLALVGGEGALWCDDDGGDGLLSRLEVPLSPGQYVVHVGTFGREIASDFTLQATLLR